MILRTTIALLLLFGTSIFFDPSKMPRLSSTGFLGFINFGIIFYILILALRHFIMLFFSALETARREGIEPSNFLPPISIIVPAFNEGVVIQRTIMQLTQINYPAFEIIVIDDGSTDNTHALALETATRHPMVRVFTKANSGKASSLNFGIKEARCEYVFCMDADSSVHSEALRLGIRHLADPFIAAVAGTVLVLNTNAIVGRFQALEYLTGLNFYKAAQSFFGLVMIIPGPSGLFRKSALTTIGGYETDTFAEDCDVTLRLLMDDKRVVFEPGMEVKTEVPGGFLQLIKQRYRWNRGILQATRKHIGKVITFYKDPVSAIVVSYMFVESVVLPITNIFIGVLSLIYVFYSLDFTVASLWLVQLTLMDLAVVVMTLWDQRWSLNLIFYALFNRFTYAFFNDIVKVLSMVEEFAGIRMNWGKLDRTGATGP
jgi:biofilm PGA synthesis N-glycosyltransferase PgaC